MFSPTGKKAVKVSPEVALLFTTFCLDLNMFDPDEHMGEAKKIASGYEVSEAWESWKNLCKHYGPVMAAQNHHGLEHYLSLAKRTANSRPAGARLRSKQVISCY